MQRRIAGHLSGDETIAGRLRGQSGTDECPRDPGFGFRRDTELEVEEFEARKRV